MKKVDYKARVRGSYKRGNKKLQDSLKKILGGVAFITACFLGVFVLLEFHDVYWLVAIACVIMMAAAYFFLGQIFANKAEQVDDLLAAQQALDEAREEDRKQADEAFKRRIEEQVSILNKTNKAMFMAMKNNAEAQEAALTKMQSEMQGRIDKVIDAQNAGVKTIIKFNKENARQASINEKEALQYIGDSLKEGFESQDARDEERRAQLDELLKATKKGISVSANVVAAPVQEASVMAQPEENFELPEESFDIPEELVAPEEDFVIPTDDVAVETVEEPISAEEEPAGDMDIVLPEEEAVVEDMDIVLPEEDNAGVSFDDALASTGVDLSDPNAALSTDDIAALFAAANAAAPAVGETPVEEEAVAEDMAIVLPEEDNAGVSLDDALANTGVDLSDPNAALSADDIAALFAAASSVSEPVAEEPKTGAALDDALANSGVDLSDPNAALSADDIAALFAAAGN